jgi:hypothetical protein
MVTIAGTWQGYLQQIVQYVGHGNYWYCQVEYPEKKRPVFTKIDEKLIWKYAADMSKFQRARRKRAGHASFCFLRWERFALIVRNQSELPGDLCADDPDVFFDIRDTPLRIKVSENVLLIVIHHGKVRVRMAAETYQGFKACIANAAAARNSRLMAWEYSRANGLPAYEGIIEQRRRLRTFTIEIARRHQIPLDEGKLRVMTSLKKVKVNTS